MFAFELRYFAVQFGIIHLFQRPLGRPLRIFEGDKKLVIFKTRVGPARRIIRVDLLNSSDWPLTIATTHVRVGQTDSLRRHEISITPKQSCSVSNIEAIITDDWYNQFLTRGAMLPVYVKIIYVNCLRKTDTQEFTGLIVCSPTEVTFQLIDLPNIRPGLESKL